MWMAAWVKKGSVLFLDSQRARGKAEQRHGAREQQTGQSPGFTFKNGTFNLKC
jgi:hypothetical protein